MKRDNNRHITRSDTLSRIKKPREPWLIIAASIKIISMLSALAPSVIMSNTLPLRMNNTQQQNDRRRVRKSSETDLLLISRTAIPNAATNTLVVAMSPQV